ncbi:transposase family protein [Orientia tsutsugamushi str. Gilliam]|uniref:Transposase family protein n=1 Tax=Orientia tsutsugamushi str. Gilliam TaxID=1359184 RepID=A0A0F3M8S6_ORITS|nr:transposase family protein [Orientia tsutsugamushi str. Gilliam]
MYESNRYLLEKLSEIFVQLVSVLNPARIKGFAMSKLSRTKKPDKADSVLIAYFCEALKKVYKR